jgi:hypothetical protein
MHMVIPSALSSLIVATLVAVGLTFLAFVVVRVVVAPLLSSWLTPSVDPTAVLFHLAPGEMSLATMPGRRRWGWSWQAGAFIVTDRRIWFLPIKWDLEPWSASRSEVVGCEAELPLFVTLLPVRNWPERLRLATRDGEHCTFAVADPRAFMRWFQPSGLAESGAFPFRTLALGVFDV